MALILYGASLSPFVRKVRVVLAEKGVAYQQEQVSPFQPPPNFDRISPLKRIPVLRDTDVPEPNTLPDSSIICDYLEHKYPNPPLYPRDAFQRARAVWLEEYADTAIATEAGRGLFFERVVKPMLRQQPDESVCKTTLTEKLPPLFDYLEKELGGRAYFVGETFGIADITVGSMFVNYKHAGESLDPARWPGLARFVKETHARPSFKACIDEETPLVQRFRGA